MWQASFAVVSRRGTIRAYELSCPLLGASDHSFARQPDSRIGSGLRIPLLFGAIGPQDVTLHWMVSEKMNTECMKQPLGQIGKAHPDRHVVMVLDGAAPIARSPLKCKIYFVDPSAALLTRTQSDGDSLA